MKHTFISYSRKNSKFVSKLKIDLESNGIKTWLDNNDIEPGNKWYEEIEKALNECDRMILVLSPDSSKADYVANEIKCAQDNEKTIIPIIFKKCEIPFMIKTNQYIDFTKNYNDGLKKLLDKLNVEEQKIEKQNFLIKNKKSFLASTISLILIIGTIFILQNFPYFPKSQEVDGLEGKTNEEIGREYEKKLLNVNIPLVIDLLTDEEKEQHLNDVRKNYFHDFTSYMEVSDAIIKICNGKEVKTPENGRASIREIHHNYSNLKFGENAANVSWEEKKKIDLEILKKALLESWNHRNPSTQYESFEEILE